MFKSFQDGVKLMSGSENCFAGALLLVIKDVVDTGAEAAVADFQRHIERLAQESEIIIDAKRKKQSTFFISQMYKGGLMIVPYPPLANEAFFDEMNDTLEVAIDDVDLIHEGGKLFLDHFKLVMSKLHIGDYSVMSGEQAKIRSQEIFENLQNAVEAGAIVQTSTVQNGVTFKVEFAQNLLLLDANIIIEVTIEEIINKIKHWNRIIADYSSINQEVSDVLLEILDELPDTGLILGRQESFTFFQRQFTIKIQANDENFKKMRNVYQLFLDLLYWRRNLRVMKFIDENSKKLFTNDEESKENVYILEEHEIAFHVSLRLSFLCCQFMSIACQSLSIVYVLCQFM
eukprot:533588_1